MNQQKLNEDLINAAENGHLEVVKYLHQNGADIRAQDDGALRWAAREGHLEVVKYLHQNGADIRAQDDWALRWATEYGRLEVVNYINSMINRDKLPKELTVNNVIYVKKEEE